MKPTRTQKTISHLKWFLAYIPFSIFAFITSYFVVILALLIELALPNFNPFWWWLDDEINNEDTNADWKVTYTNYPKWFKYYWWHANRNKMWNFQQKYIKVKKARENCKWNEEVIQEILQNSLTNNYERVDIFGDCLMMAGFKWITENGEEGWHVFRGKDISRKYSILGTCELWYRAKGTLYYRYSTAKRIKLFGKSYWFYFAIGNTQKRRLLNFKIYKYTQLK
jgi:hypothetical protein